MNEKEKLLVDAIKRGELLANHAEPCFICHQPGQILLTDPLTGVHKKWVCQICWTRARKEAYDHK